MFYHRPLSNTTRITLMGRLLLFSRLNILVAIVHDLLRHLRILLHQQPQHFVQLLIRLNLHLLRRLDRVELPPDFNNLVNVFL